MIDDHAMIWLALRERRARLREQSDLLGSSASRRETFGAAMHQFEEQMAAARTVSPATRPVNLYYGLVQAGTAMAALHVPTEPWSFNKHGLELVDTRPELPEVCVRPQGDGAFQRVAAATGSPTISSPVSLQALWASLPDLCEPAPLPDSASPKALMFGSPSSFMGFSQLQIHTGGGGPAMSIAPLFSAIYIDVGLPEPAEREAWINELMTHYPAAAGWQLPEGDDPVPFQRIRDDRCEVLLKWPESGRESLTDEQVKAFLDKIAPEYRYNEDRYLRPTVDESRSLPPSPLMTWWLLLYSFSMLARYQPRKWMDLLNVDRNRYAVRLELALDSALTVIPQLVLAAIDGRPTLYAKPLAF